MKIMVQRRWEAASESRLQIYRYLIYVSIYQIASSERHEDDGRTFRKEEKLTFRRIKKNELRRSERENRVGFPGRVNICVQKGFEEEEEQKKEEENASSRSKNS